MVELPTGTVTFLFTDIEGSTRLLAQLRTRYDELHADHQRLLRETFAAHGGREVDTQGDSFFVAFASATDAVASAIDAQRAVAAHTWPEGVVVRVRMGLHSGEPRATGERYIGFGVHRAARIAAAGHGGQILISNATRELVEDELAPDSKVRDLGAYRLKDLSRPERLYQVEAQGIPSEFPPLRAPRVGGSRRRRRVSAAVAGVLAALALALVVWTETSSSPSLGSAEKPITIVTPWYEKDAEQLAFDEVLETFEQTTGLRTEVQSTGGGYQAVMQERVEQSNLPTIAFVSPSLLAEYARAGLAKPLTDLGIGDDELSTRYGRTWIDLGTVDGETYGVPTAANSKSLVWYRPRELGRPPRTWDELVAVTEKIARAGKTPWVIGASDSFTLTDWFENVYISTAGPWKYDGLFAGRLPFDDSSVIAALERMTALLQRRHVLDLRAGSDETSFPDAVVEVFGPQPGAHLFMGGGFVGPFALAAIQPAPEPGRTIAAASFPTVDRAIGNPVVVGADFVVSFSDAGEVRTLLQYLTSPGAGRIWVSTGTIVSPNKSIPPSAYPNELVRAAAEQVAGAKDVRFDGSDLLPGSLGMELGSTLQRVLRRPEDIRRLMAAFQADAARVFNG